MAHRKLEKKPLVEAMVEIRWSLTQEAAGREVDPHYKLLLGRFYDRVQPEYPEHEQLPTASIPDEMVGHMVQHRFRVGKDQWPLVQLGPGILTINSTDDYTWASFRPRAIAAVRKLLDSYPKPAEMKVETMILRHIDAVEFDYGNADALSFLRDKLKVQVAFPSNLFDDAEIDQRPSILAIHASFQCRKPNGMMHLRFTTGQKKGQPAIVWETTMRSQGDEVPELSSSFSDWIDAAHAVTGDWFFKLIAGELERRFADEQD